MINPVGINNILHVGQITLVWSPIIEKYPEDAASKHQYQESTFQNGQSQDCTRSRLMLSQHVFYSFQRIVK